MRPRLLAIDWSGADPASGIAVAALQWGSKCPEILPPPGKKWTREAVLTLLREQAKEDTPTIAGIDCNFALPFNGKKYVPRVTATVAHKLWKKIEEACADASDLYAGAFVQKNQDGFWCQEPKPAYFDPRLRATEKFAEACGLNPKSPFNMNGAGVGMAGLSGMRLLHQLKQTQGLKNRIAVWPFEERSDATPLTMVEIYPAVFLMKATGSTDKIKTQKKGGNALKQLREAVEELGCELNGDISEPIKDHVSDAIISVAGMAWMLSKSKQQAWAPNWLSGLSQKKRHAEGWIFGVDKELMRK